MPNISKVNGSPAALRQRVSFAKTPSVLELPDLIETQKRSYAAFLQRFVPDNERESKGLQALFEEVFPIYDFKETTSLEFVSYTLSPPTHDLSDCQARGLNYQVRLQARLMCVEREKDEDTGQTRVLDITESEVYLGDIPLMTENGTFIINGSERVIVNQLQRSPGVIFLDKSHASSVQKLPTGQIIPYRGAWIEFEYDSKDCIHVRLDRKKKLLVTVLLRALGWETNAEILKLFGNTEIVPMTQDVVGRVIAESVVNKKTGEVLLEANTKMSEIEFDRLMEANISEVEVLVESDEQELRFLRNTLSRDTVKAYAGGTLQEGALLEIFRTLRPGDAPTREAASSCLERLFFDGARYDLGVVGRYKINSKLGDLSTYQEESGEMPSEEIRVLRKEDIAATLQYLMDIRNGHRNVDDLDHLGNRRVRVIGELLENQFRIALLQIRRSAREKLSTTTDAQLKNPKNVVVPKPLMMSLREFFGSNQLSQFMQQINPLDELTHKRRISAIGPGGLHRDRATAAVRDVHRTHYGRVCPLETPEGPSIGLIVSLATFARVNPYGFLETPYRPIVDGVIGNEIYKITQVPENSDGIKAVERYKVSAVPDAIVGTKIYKVIAMPDDIIKLTHVPDAIVGTEHHEVTAVPDGYSSLNDFANEFDDDKQRFYDSKPWKHLSQEYRKYVNWKCEKCSIDLKGHTKYLDVHHINSIHDNYPKHLAALCIGCHDLQPDHDFKNAERYINFIDEYSDKWDPPDSFKSDIDSLPDEVQEELYKLICGVKVGDILSPRELEELEGQYNGFETKSFWSITTVNNSECPLKKGEVISDIDYEKVLKKYVFPQKKGDQITQEIWDTLSRTWKGLKYEKCCVELGDEFTPDEWKNLIDTWEGLKPGLRWRITEVNNRECSLKIGQVISHTKYQETRKDYECKVKQDDLITRTRRVNLLKTWVGLETEQGKQINKVFNPICLNMVNHFVTDTEYEKVYKKYQSPKEGDELTPIEWEKLKTWDGLESEHYRKIIEVNHPDCSLKVGALISETEYKLACEKYPRFFSKDVEYLTADAEDKYNIAPADAIAKDSRSKSLRSRKGEEVIERDIKEIDYIGIAPQQIVGVSAALVPFLEHEDANRALMGANHQRQAVPLICPEAPWVGTGMEHRAARDANAMVVANRGGVVSSVDAEEILIRTGQALHLEEGENTFSEMGYDVYKLKNFKRSNSGTCIHQRPRVDIGDVVEAGDVIADGTATEGGELALGRNILCAYMPWGGHNFEDSILISESLIKNDTFTSIHIEEFEVAARQTKMGDEEITRDIPNMSPRSLAQLDDEGIIRIGSVVGTGSILVGKISPKGESESGPEEKLLRAIFGEKVKEVKDASAYTRPGVEGVVIDVKVFSRQATPNSERTAWRQDAQRKKIEQTYQEQCQQVLERLTEGLRETLINKELAYPTTFEVANDSEGTDNSETPTQLNAGDVLTREYLETLSKSELETLQVTDKDASTYIKSLQELAKGRIDAYTKEKNDALEKLDAGEELKPGVLKLVKVYVASRRPISVGDKMAGRYGNKGVVAKILPEEDMPYMPDGTPVDIVLNPLGVPSRMNVGQILEIHLGLACKELGLHISSPVFDGATEDEVFDMLDKTDLPDNVKETGKSVLYDGRTGEPFGQEVTVGYVYFLKLNHLVADKMHARSTGPYSLVTQQPLGGKAQHGGQRLGEMEVWALEAYGAAHTLQEMLTIKSDDVKGRTKIYESIVKGQSPMKPGTPESFNVLVRELQSLGLNVELTEGDPSDADTEQAGLHDTDFPLLHTLDTMEPIEDEPPLKLTWDTDDTE